MARQRGDGYIERRVSKSGAVSYRARFYDSIQDYWPSVKFDTKEEAEEFLTDRSQQMRAGNWNDTSTLTVSQAVSDTLITWRGRLKPRTLLNYRQRADAYIVPFLGDRLVRTVKPLDIQQWVRKLEQRGYAATTIGGAVAVLSGVFRDLVVLEIAHRNPVQGVRLPSIEVQEYATWTVDEARKVLEKVGSHPIYGAIYSVAIVAGMRPGELRIAVARRGFRTASDQGCRHRNSQ